MAEIQIYTDYDSGDTTLPIAYPDAARDPGTLCILDMRDPASYESGTLPPSGSPLGEGTLLYDWVAEAFNVATRGTNSGGVGGAGIVYDTANQYAILPASCKLAAGATHFGFGAWIKPSRPAITTGQYAAIGSYCTSTSAANIQWLIQQAGALPDVYAGYVSGALVNITVTAGEVAQVFWEAAVSAGNVTVRGYKNGVLVGTSAPYALAGGVLPVPAANAYIGSFLFQSPGWRGQIGRFLFQDFSVAGSRTVTDFLANDLALNAGRFT